MSFILRLHLGALVLEPKFDLQRLQPQLPTELLPLLVIWVWALLEKSFHLLDLALSVAMITLPFGPVAGIFISGGNFVGFGAGFGFIIVIFQPPQFVFGGFCGHIKYMMTLKHIWLEHFDKPQNFLKFYMFYNLISLYRC
uniref:Homeobox protein n=1 Tax=Rhizophora mucronata TaxID=61149 RepID=A0A2P2K262_RHIMU